MNNPDALTATHTPVLLHEAIKTLSVQPGGRYIDCTIGAGGHAASILEQSSPGGQLLGIDTDPEALEIARKRLSGYPDSCLLVNDNFVNLEAICIKHDFLPVHGILFDLGLSSLQLASGKRGFSFQKEGPLDMRFSPEQKITAADIVNKYSENELSSLIRIYGEENHSRRIAHAIVRERPIKTTLELARTVERAIGRRDQKIHPATKTFQALRIVVNHEMENLEKSLKQAIGLLGFRGRLVVISYHSLEDRIVKRLMQQEARDCICPPSIPVCICGHHARLRLVTRKVITPSPGEIETNQRSRSAKLRATERIAPQDEYYRAIEENGFSTNSQTNGWRRPSFLEKLRITYAATR